MFAPSIDTIPIPAFPALVMVMFYFKCRERERERGGGASTVRSLQSLVARHRTLQPVVSSPVQLELPLERDELRDELRDEGVGWSAPIPDHTPPHPRPIVAPSLQSLVFLSLPHHMHSSSTSIPYAFRRFKGSLKGLQW